MTGLSACYKSYVLNVLSLRCLCQQNVGKESQEEEDINSGSPDNVQETQPGSQSVEQIAVPELSSRTSRRLKVTM